MDQHFGNLMAYETKLNQKKTRAKKTKEEIISF
jgi:hypothetical protein